MIQTSFPNNDTLLQDGNSRIHTTGTVHSWFDEHEGQLPYLPRRAQSPDLNIIEPLWPVLETRVRNRYPPPKSLKQLKYVLQEQWYKILLEAVPNLYEFFPRKIAAVLKAKGGRTPYYKEMCTVSVPFPLFCKPMCILFTK
jgi:hypothetical protein